MLFNFLGIVPSFPGFVECLEKEKGNLAVHQPGDVFVKKLLLLFDAWFSFDQFCLFTMICHLSRPAEFPQYDGFVWMS